MVLGGGPGASWDGLGGIRGRLGVILEGILQQDALSLLWGVDSGSAEDAQRNIFGMQKRSLNRYTNETAIEERKDASGN